MCNTLMNWAQKSASMGESKHRGCIQCSMIEVVTKRADLEVAGNPQHNNTPRSEIIKTHND